MTRSSRTRVLVAGIGGRAFLYLLNVGVGLGILSVLLIGGAMSFTIGADTIVQVLVASFYQAAVLGAIIGFLATVEYVMFLELRSRVTGADAIPD